ncbi:MAG: glycosyltransferase family 4 protein [bacterium]
MRILHVLDHSLPYVTDYSLKGRYIIKLQKDFGLNPVVITSPSHALVSNPIELIEGVFHYRTFLPEESTPPRRGCPFLKERLSIVSLGQAIYRVASKQKIDVIHVHSPAFNGIAALEAGQKRNIPLLYEIHDFGEKGLPKHAPGMREPVTQALRKGLDRYLCQQAGAVVITEKGLRERMIEEEISEEKIYTVSYGDDSSLLKPIQNEEEIQKRYNLQNSPVIGFIGSLFNHEGADCLLQAFLKVREKIPETKLLLIDDGHGLPKARAAWHDVSGHIIYVGQVKQKDIQRYYSLIDVLVYPQLKMNTGEDSSIQQPMEAMALGKAIIASDMSSLRKLIIDKKTGLLFKAGDISDLAGKCLKLVINKHLRQTLGDCARFQMAQDRKWLQVMAQYLRAYKNLLSY